MFGIGESELVIIVVFGFLLFGPDKLPGMGRTVGRFLRQFREAQEGFQQVVQAEVVDPLNDAMNSPEKKAEIDSDSDIEGTDSEVAARKSETFAERKARLQAERKAREEAEKAAAEKAAAEEAAEAAEAEPETSEAASAEEASQQAEAQAEESATEAPAEPEAEPEPEPEPEPEEPSPKSAAALYALTPRKREPKPEPVEDTPAADAEAPQDESAEAVTEAAPSDEETPAAEATMPEAVDVAPGKEVGDEA